jgi:hypothetical protein
MMTYGGMEMNGQLLAPATSPLEDQPPAPTVYEAGWAQNCVAATEKKYFVQVYHNQNKVYTFPQNNEIIRH